MPTARPRLLLLWLLASLTLAAQPITVATYNIYFLDDGISAERKANLETVLAGLDADVIAFQEINNPAALKNILSDDYAVVMLDDPEEVHDLALAVRQPLAVHSARLLFTDPAHDYEFPRSRDILEVRVMAHGRELVFLVHHAKSRSGGRMQTDERREGASVKLVQYIREKLAGESVILLGDFNDNPDDRSLNILETGDPQALGGIDDGPDAFLHNVTEPLAARDIVSYGYGYLFDSLATDTFPRVVAGARAENLKWMGKPHDYRTDVVIKAVLLDQILVSADLAPLVRAVDVYNGTAAIFGDRSRIRFTDNGLVYTFRGTQASDHVPVWVRLELPPREAAQPDPVQN